MTLNLTINDCVQAFDAPLSVTQLLEQLDLIGKPVAVELNLELVPHAQHATTQLSDGDCLEIVSLTGGG